MRLPGMKFFGYLEKQNSNLSIKKTASHEDFCKRVSKTLYYGKDFKQDKGSLSLTSLAVNLFCKFGIEPSLDKLNLDRAASISHEACISPCSLILAILYLERLAVNNPEYLSKVSSSRLFLISVMVASKFMNDEGVEDEVFNDEWAASAGLDVSELNELEREFLGAIDWSLFVDSESFELFRTRVEKAVALQQSALNDFFTYTELDTLGDGVLLQECWDLLAENVLKVAAVSLTAYAASVFTLVGSALLVGRLPFAMNDTLPAVWDQSFDLSTPFVPLTSQLDFSFEELPPLDSTLPDSFKSLGAEFENIDERVNSTIDEFGNIFWNIFELPGVEQKVMDPFMYDYKDTGDRFQDLRNPHNHGWANVFLALKA